MNVPRRTNVTKLSSTYIAEHEEKKQKAARRRRVVAVRLVVWSLLFAMFASALVYTLHSQAKAIDAKTAEQQKLKEQLAELERKEKQLKEEMKSCMMMTISPSWRGKNITYRKMEKLFSSCRKNNFACECPFSMGIRHIDTQFFSFAIIKKNTIFKAF